ncbi:MAG: prolipoprotein diacylglyceryl transferase, partial [Alphaproteobacteria bacterium]|nr:prolipoprotein diacylglyceryl transferase [Alphaproteobacteria bacterium]
FADILSCAAPIGLFFGRIANFINGELYGRVTDVPWGMVFPRGGPVPRHPSQLYEAVGEGLILLAVLWVVSQNERSRKRIGLRTGIFMAGYGLVRFVVEYVREPDAFLGTWAGITMGQALCVPMMALGTWLIIKAMAKKPKLV